MINIHGGGLFASFKEVNRYFNYAIAKMGYTVISLSYRRIPETTLIHQIEDVMAAISDVVTDRSDRAKPYEKYMLDPLSVLNVSSLPPMIQITSTEDAIHLDSLKVRRRLREHGIEHEMHDYPLGIERHLVHVFSVMYPDWPESQEVYGHMDRWFKEH